jgi:hypothetical protein
VEKGAGGVQGADKPHAEPLTYPSGPGGYGQQAGPRLRYDLDSQKSCGKGGASAGLQEGRRCTTVSAAAARVSGSTAAAALRRRMPQATTPIQQVPCACVRAGGPARAGHAHQHARRRRGGLRTRRLPARAARRAAARAPGPARDRYAAATRLTRRGAAAAMHERWRAAGRCRGCVDKATQQLAVAVRRHPRGAAGGPAGEVV